VSVTVAEPDFVSVVVCESVVVPVKDRDAVSIEVSLRDFVSESVTDPVWAIVRDAVSEPELVLDVVRLSVSS
jgi:hypothetical protein